MKNPDCPKSTYPPEFEEFLSAYLLSELTPEESAVFEMQLEKYPSLRNELEQRKGALESIKGWIMKNPPGEEKLEDLIIPQVSKRSRSLKKSIPFFRLSFRFLVWQGSIVTIVFALGFFLGQRGMDQVQVAPPSSVQQIQSPSAPFVPEESDPSRIAKQPENSSRKESEFIPTQYTTEKDGKLIVETTLKNSGTRVLWVVDGNFELDSETQDPDSKI